MNYNRIFLLIIFLFVFTLSCSDDTEDIDCHEAIEALCINEYQVIGSHNSYRKNTQMEIAQLFKDSVGFVPPWFNPLVWDYDHEPLLDQLDIYQMRSLEIDVYRDPEGGLFYNRQGNQFVDLDIASGEEELLNPGLKILHFPDFDYNTHHLTLIDALENLKNWSETNSNHLPLIVFIQAKEDSPALLFSEYDLTETLFFDNDSVEEIEAEINEVFSSESDQILKPDDVRDVNLSLRETITERGWPTLRESRGKILFVLMASNQIVEDYTFGHPNLEDRNMFVFTDSLSDAAAFIKIDNPLSNESEIRSLVEQGFIVRTRADADTVEARTGSYDRMNAAFASKAQIISTDYYRPDPRSINDTNWTNYTVDLPNEQIAIIIEQEFLSKGLDCQILE